jgi:uncharacterized protein YggE
MPMMMWHANRNRYHTQIATIFVFEMRVLVAVVVLLVGLVVANQTGQTASSTVCGNSHRVVSVTGNGAVSVQPDCGVVSFTVEDTESSASDALDGVAAASTAVLDSLRTRFSIDATRDVSSNSFSVQPSYDWTTATRSLLGYVVSSSYSVNVRNISDVSRVVDNVVRSGGNYVRIDSVSFMVEELEKHQSHARELAVKNAMIKATELITPTGGKLGRLESISAFDNSAVTPIYSSNDAFSAAKASSAVPISSGSNIVSASVQATFRIC